MDYGIQMYSVRDITEQDLQGALKQMAEIGYKNIEFAGFFGHTADEINTWIKEYGLNVSGTHSVLDLLINDYEGTVAFNKAIGNTEYIIPGAPMNTKEELDYFIEKVNEIQPKLAAEGIRMSYHNHDHEFRPNQDGIVPYPELVKRTNLFLEIDTYWAFAGGQDPIAMMEELKDRLIFIHIKDGMGDREGKPLGQGVAPVAAVYEKAKAMGIPMIVESETLQPDGPTEAKICFEYLKSQE